MKSCASHCSKPKNMAVSGCRKGLGKGLIILGFLSIVFGIASIPVCISDAKYLGAPIWSGIFILITGAIGVKSGCGNKSNGWLTAFLVLSVISVMVVLTAFTWTIGGITGDIGALHGYEEGDYYSDDYYSESEKDHEEMPGIEEWFDALELDHIPENFDELVELLPDNFEEMDGFEDLGIDLEDLRNFDQEEWEEWIDHILSGGSDVDESEVDEYEDEEYQDRKKREDHHGGHHGNRPRPDDHMEDGDGEGHGETWFDWDEDRMGEYSDGGKDKHYEDELDGFHTSIAMYSITMILAFLEIILVFASAITACCGLCKSPSQVVPQQVVVLQPGQQIVPGANGQFVLVTAGYGQDVGIYHGNHPMVVPSTDMTPSTNPALTVKPSGQPHGRLPPLATAPTFPTYEEAVALPPKDDPAPEYQEADELPTKISL